MYKLIGRPRKKNFTVPFSLLKENFWCEDAELAAAELAFERGVERFDKSLLLERVVKSFDLDESEEDEEALDADELRVCEVADGSCWELFLTAPLWLLVTETDGREALLLGKGNTFGCAPFS